MFARGESGLLRARQALGTGVHCVRGDVTRSDDLARLFRETHERFGKIHVVLANAAVVKLAPIADTADAIFDECSKKTAGYVRLGVVDPERLVFNTDYVRRVESLTKRDAANALQTVEDLHDRVFATHPLQIGGGSTVDDILDNETLRSFFSLG